MHRTQIYLDNQSYKILERESEVSNLSMSEIIRRSIRKQRADKTSEIIKKMENIFGIWKNRNINPERYIRKLRMDRKI